MQSKKNYNFRDDIIQIKRAANWQPRYNTMFL